MYWERINIRISKSKNNIKKSVIYWFTSYILICIKDIMENQEFEQSLRDYPKQITNNSYLELLEKYFLSDKTNDLENKHKEWCNQISN